MIKLDFSRLPPVAERNEYIQCTFPVNKMVNQHLYRDWRAHRAAITGRDPDACNMEAQVGVNGRPYCERHAGKIALSVQLGEFDEQEGPTGQEDR